MQELLVHLVCRDSLLQAVRNMFHCAFDTGDAKLIPPPRMFTQTGGRSRCIHTTQTSYQRDLLVSMGDRPLDRNIWEAFYHRLGVLVLGMILETDVAQKKGIRHVTPSGRGE